MLLLQVSMAFATPIIMGIIIIFGRYVFIRPSGDDGWGPPEQPESLRAMTKRLLRETKPPRYVTYTWAGYKERM